MLGLIDAYIGLIFLLVLTNFSSVIAMMTNFRVWITLIMNSCISYRSIHIMNTIFDNRVINDTCLMGLIWLLIRVLNMRISRREVPLVEMIILLVS